MKQILILKLAIILILCNVDTLKANGDFKKDSIDVTKTVNAFFDWYMNSIKRHQYNDYQPIFVKSKDDMTTLNMDKYVDNLKRYSFSDSSIIKEIDSYKTCKCNLSKVKYSDFEKTKFVDLSEYIDSKCDFGNYYRWIGGQELCDGLEIKTINFINKTNCEIGILKYSFKEDKSRVYWNYVVKVRLIKNKNSWKIDDIKWK
jgi:hypothetical protein